jgi:hypothetical protein
MLTASPLNIKLQILWMLDISVIGWIGRVQISYWITDGRPLILQTPS